MVRDKIPDKMTGHHAAIILIGETLRAIAGITLREEMREGLLRLLMRRSARQFQWHLRLSHPHNPRRLLEGSLRLQ
jgi:hypothetical protein